MSDCFFETSTSLEYDGAVSLWQHSLATLSNCAFVSCSSSACGGAMGLYYVQSIDFSFLQFRGCSAGDSKSNDIYIRDMEASLVTEDTVKFCDSTSARPNVFVDTGSVGLSALVPQISSTPTIKSVDVSIDGSVATVRVETEEALKGTMGVLLGGSNVPRLVHVVFGKPWEESTIGTAVVSSGANGILPDDTSYTNRTTSFATDFFPPPTVRTADATRKDVKATEIVLKGVHFYEEGSHWMLVGKEETEWNITLTRSDSTTLTGTASLSSSNGEVVLEWYSTYELRRAVWVFPDGETEKDVKLDKAITFTTPVDTTPPFSLLTGVSAHIIKADPKNAVIFLHFDREVSGSYDFVVEERRKNVMFTVVVESAGTTGETEEFVVVGDSRMLTDDTTYTIKSLVATPGSSSTPVVMNDAISFHIPKSSFVPPVEPEDPDKKAMSKEMKALLSWLIPVVVSVCFALIVIIVILVLVNRRRAKSINAKSEMEEQEPVELEKVEEVGVDCSNGVIRADGMTHSAFVSTEDRQSNKEATKENKSGEGEGECVEVMACSGDFAISVARMDSTLYSMLHKERREIGKRGIEMQIVNGLKHVVAHRGWSDLLTRLSSHWILVDTAGNVQLKLEMSSTEADAEAARQRQKEQQQPNMEGYENEHTKGDENTRGKCEGEKSGMDGLRWRAPEVVAAEERSGVESVDGHKASVFSLGLILWEIETGQVPFGELDAVNAQRQSGTGIGPNMEDLKNEEFVSLIHRCVSVDPKERPTLTEIGEFLSSHPEDTRAPSGHEMKE
ncbi:hypothetical protein BLNAU_19511 [Blattamonas nauphoetae]|uniref:Protein kinase domain-containing protein n=1 Tax=Blattamonas nauphoetae TaxID=2049346 RepID=A0ABQ9X194_9EUKA|nr:hypothetical protein BLNAU_19511 [Blattamonas nauphoetae]